MVTISAAVPRPALVPLGKRALVILRDGLTPTLHWAHAFLCATSCLIGGDGLIGGHDFARSGCLHPPANGQTQRTPEESPAAKVGFFLCATQLTPLTTGRDNQSP